MKVLVDTSVWSRGELTELIREGRAGVIGFIRQELLSGIKTEAQFEQLRKTLNLKLHSVRSERG